MLLYNACTNVNPFKPIFFTGPNENEIATNKPALATKNYTYNNVVNRRV
jgi:hypothetical protein